MYFWLTWVASGFSFFIYKICSFLKFGIFPVFVFDSDAPLEKHDAIKKRFNAKSKSREKLEQMLKTTSKSNLSKKSIKRLERQLFIVTKYHRYSLIKLLDCFKLPYFIAEGEAEVLLLCCKNTVMSIILYRTIRIPLHMGVWKCWECFATVRGTW